MKLRESKNKIACPLPSLSAYIDGELAPNEELELEQHVLGCRVCTDDLNLQKSFLNALDFSLEDDKQIELPKDFTRSVVANAESRVSGLRRPHERRNAAFICTALIVFAFFALGSNAEKTFVATAAIADKFFAVFASAGHLFYDVALGSAIIFRSLASKLFFESGFSALAFLALFVLSLYVFSRLLVRYHRT